MVCPDCGKKNAIYALKCRHCGTELQSQEELDAKLKAMWEGLPPEAQKNINEKYESDFQRYFEDIESVRRLAKRHIITSAVALGLMGLTTGFFIIPDILIGALAGSVLHSRKGGAFWGLVLFSGAYLFSFIIKQSLGLAFNLQDSRGGYFSPLIVCVLLWGGGGLAVSFGGYYGYRIEQQCAGQD